MISTAIQKALNTPTESRFDAFTWVERVRMVTGEPVNIDYWHIPVGEYAQLITTGKVDAESSQLERYYETSEGVSNHPVMLASSIRQPIEGILHESGFIGGRPITLDGGYSNDPDLDYDLLIKEGFRAVKFTESAAFGRNAIEYACIEEPPNNYELRGIMFTVSDDALRITLEGVKELPEPYLFVEFNKCERTVSLASETTLKDNLTFFFIGTLDQPQKVYKLMAEEAGHNVAKSKKVPMDYIVSDHWTNDDSELIDCKIITSEEFEELIK